jgi:hypothetical protein
MTTRRAALAATTAVLATALTGAGGSVLAPSAMASSPAPAHAGRHRGQLVRVTPVGLLTRHGVARHLAHASWTTDRVRSGITAYRVVYSTVDRVGVRTTASGLAVLPRTGTHRLTPLLFEHGTTSYRPDVASTYKDSFLTGPGLLFGSAGYAAALPDYLGLGQGPGRHPYFDVPSETTASIDMLRATRQLVARHDRELRSGLLVTDFSQGASAALGVARAVQHGATPRFHVAGVAPISGAYDLRRVEIPALLDGGIAPQLAPIYAAYALTSWNWQHHLYSSTSEIFRAPYDRRVDHLFSGHVPGGQMLRRMPTSIDALLTHRGIQLFRHPTPRFAHVIAQADSVCRWTPDMPVRLFATRGDEQAATADTPSCARSFRHHHVAVDVRLVPNRPFQGSAHLGSSITGTERALRWFPQLV